MSSVSSSDDMTWDDRTLDDRMSDDRTLDDRMLASYWASSNSLRMIFQRYIVLSVFHFKRIALFYLGRKGKYRFYLLIRVTGGSSMECNLS